MLKFIVAGMAALSMGLASAQANEGPLVSTLEARIVTVDDAGVETLVETEEVSPGDTIEYTLTYENTADRALSEIVINAPIPAASIYIMNSAQQVDGVAFTASADDGDTWGTPPLMMATADGQVEVPVADYDFLRWSPAGAIEAGESWSFTYRVNVE